MFLFLFLFLFLGGGGEGVPSTHGVIVREETRIDVADGGESDIDVVQVVVGHLAYLVSGEVIDADEDLSGGHASGEGASKSVNENQKQKKVFFL